MKIRKTIIFTFIFGIFYCCCQCGPRVLYNLYEIPVIYPPLSKNEQVTLIKMSRDNSFINIDSHHFKLTGDKTGQIYWHIGTFIIEKGTEKERYDLAASNARTLGADTLLHSHTYYSRPGFWAWLFEKDNRKTPREEDGDYFIMARKLNKKINFKSSI